MLLFYMIPIAIATWFSGIWIGMAMVVLSMGADLISDRLAAVPPPPVWNVVTSLLYYVVFAVLLSRWRNLVQHMQARVEERTADLQREVVARKQLEREAATIAEHERRRLGRELHDSLCQHLAGTAMQAKTLARRVQAGDDRAAANADHIVHLVNRGVELARSVARGLFSPELEAEGLVSALQSLAVTTSQQHQVDCAFTHDVEPNMSPEKATHLYWIAREAVSNAIRHANPRHIEIQLGHRDKLAELCVTDDGKGIRRAATEHSGIGLQVMKQRAELAGGSLLMGQSGESGTVVRCAIPVDY